MKNLSKAMSILRVSGSVRWGLRTALLGVALAAAGFGHANAITLDDAVRTAVLTNPDVGVVSNDRRAIDQELRQARALYLPSIDLRYAAGREIVRSRAGGLPGLNHARLFRTEASATLTQLLFDGFSAASEVQRQKARSKSAARRVAETSEFTGLDAVQAFLDVLRQQQLVSIAKNNVGIHESTLSDMKQRLAGGTGSVADVRQAESRIARSRVDLTEARQNLNDARANYIRVVGEEPGGLVRPNSLASALPATVDEAVAWTLNGNPTVAVAAADIGTAQAQLRASRADYFPKINLELTAQRDRNINAVKGSSQNFRAMVVARWNIFRGGQTVAETREFVQRLAEARSVLGASQRRAEEQTRISWNALQSAKGRTTSLTAQVTANEAVRDAYMQQFNLGQRSLLDVLDSENELFISRSDLVTAEFVELFAQYRLLAASGMLLDTLGVQKPDTAIVGGNGKGWLFAAGDDRAKSSDTAVAADEGAAEGDVVAPETAETETVVPEEGDATAEAAPTQTSEPAVVVDESVLDKQPAASGKAVEATASKTPEASKTSEAAPAAPKEGFKQAEGKVTDDTLLSLNFNPLWNTE